MAMSDKAGPLNLTVPSKVIEFLDYLADQRLSNYGTSKNGIATFIVMREVDRMMKKDRYALYWKQGAGPAPPKPAA